MLPIRNIAINVNYVNEITLSLLKMEISIYYEMDAKDKEMAGIKDIEKIR